jgi:hypothetical protein
MKVATIPGDYDGAIKAWNTIKRVPENIKPFVEYVVNEITDSSHSCVVELGAGKCLTSAAIANRIGGNAAYYAADVKWMGVASGDYVLVTTDVLDLEAFRTFLEAVQPQLIVARRALCLFLSEEWLNLIPKGTILISQGLSGETNQEFFSAEAEVAFLQQNRWEILCDPNEHGIYTAVKNDDSISAAV